MSIDQLVTLPSHFVGSYREDNLEYQVFGEANISIMSNLTAAGQACNTSTGCLSEEDIETMNFEAIVKVVIPILFGIIAILGFAGNLLVIIVVVSNKQMRNTTNVLIINLAVADLMFIVICVPFTTTVYALPIWPFGEVWCKIYQYMIFVTAYASVYTLVMMSLDRYLAVVHPISSMSIRNERNAYFMISLSWIVILLVNIPILVEYTPIEYEFLGKNRSACLNPIFFTHPNRAKIFHVCFFAFAYCIPLTLVCVLYGFMIKRLLHGVVPRGNQSAESIRSKKRVTRMVVIVVALFALCWLPIQIVFLILHVGNPPNNIVFLGIQMAANCLAYMNSCVNPFLYAFLSENFRKSFKKLLCRNRILHERMEFERTHAKGLEPATTRTYTCNNATNNNEQCV